MGRRRLDLPTTEIADRYIAGETMDELATTYGVSFSTIDNRLREQNVPKRPPGNPQGSAHPFYLYGGYQCMRDRSGKWCNLHRACWEAHYGPIRRGWHIHHIDGDKMNNDISNLIPVPPAFHLRFFHGSSNNGEWQREPCMYKGQDGHWHATTRIRRVRRLP